MSDAKKPYSIMSNYYVTNKVANSVIDQVRYNSSKLREKQFNENWIKHKVNINDIVDKFTPNCIGKTSGVKFEFENNKYVVRADMVSGYLRIYDKSIDSYIKLDGSQSDDDNETHYKIMKKEEM